MVRIIQEVVRLKEGFEAHLILFHYISCVTILELSSSTQLAIFKHMGCGVTFTLNSSRLNMGAAMIGIHVQKKKKNAIKRRLPPVRST